MQICSFGGCDNITDVSLKSGVFSTTLKGPLFRAGVYYIGLQYGDNLLLQTSSFFLTSGLCKSCREFQIHP